MRRPVGGENQSEELTSQSKILWLSLHLRETRTAVLQDAVVEADLVEAEGVKCKTIIGEVSRTQLL
jgi:hypothetical protein